MPPGINRCSADNLSDTCMDSAGLRSAQVESELRIILHAAELDNLQTPV